MGTLSGTNLHSGQVYFHRFPTLFIIGSKIRHLIPAWFGDTNGTMVHVLNERIESYSDGSAIRADVRETVIHGFHAPLCNNERTCESARHKKMTYRIWSSFSRRSSFKQLQPNNLVDNEIAIKAIYCGPPVGSDKHTRTMRTSIDITHCQHPICCGHPQ
jgi:hypothetical protein